jgi:(p)ppGpp synthase/HD superfamily hydrolase
MERFGKQVMELVLSVTEQGRGLSWEQRKKEALDHIEHFSDESLLVKSADILSNGRELLDDYAREGEEVFSHFSAPKEKVLENQLKIIAAICEKWPANPLTQDLLCLAGELQLI